LFVIGLVALTLGGTARADFFVGNPTSTGSGADNWQFALNSLDNNRYIRGAGGFSFDMYRTVDRVRAGDALATMASPWAVGDFILGMGGVILGAPNLTGSVRIVSKFTSFTKGQFTASTNPSPNGNGAGNFSNGDGGIGAVLIGNTPGAVTAANAGMLLTPTTAFQWDGGLAGPNGLTISPDTARYVYQVNGSGLLKSWEVLLNVTKLNSQNTGLLAPDYDGHWNQSLQRGTSNTLYTDTINQHSPLPPTLVALVGGAGLLGLGRRLRRGA